MPSTPRAPAPFNEQLPAELTAQYVETPGTAVARARQAPLEFSGQSISYGSFGAEGRVLGLLALRLLSDAPTTLRLADAVGREGLDPRSGSARFLTRELVGFLLARLSGQIVDVAGRPARPAALGLQNQALAASGGTLAEEGMRAYPFVDGYPGAPASNLIESFAAPDGATAPVRGELERELAGAGLGAPSPDDMAELVKALVEAVDNTRKHATADLAMRPIGGVRLLAVKWRRFRDLASAAFDAPALAGMPDYVQRLGDKHGSATLRDRYLVEFLVGDCGVGISAHKSGSTRIYTGPLTAEIDALDSAFRSSESSSRDGWEGFGLLKIQKAARALDAFLVVRTGRLLATRHHLDGTSDVMHVVPQPGERPLLGGTTLSVFVPWTDAQDTLFGIR